MSRRLPKVWFCEERLHLVQAFVDAVRELGQWQSEQVQAIIGGDPDFGRFDILIHMAAERKEQCKYAVIAHVETHACEEALAADAPHKG
jgi:hypothetical protein